MGGINWVNNSIAESAKEMKESNKVVISNTNSSITFSEMRNQLEALDGRFPEIHEVIIVSEDEQMRHYIRTAHRVTLN